MKLAIESAYPAQPRQFRAPNHDARVVMPPDDFAAQSPFLLMAEDWFAPPAGFPTHPHRGMETVTVVLDGQLIHNDHTGAYGVIDAGGIQFMTGGGGVLHSELPGPHGVHTLQLWLNLPAHLKRTPARYRDIQPGDVPVHREAGVLARVFAGKLGTARRAHGSTWPITIVDLTLEAGASFDLPVPAGERVFIYGLLGEGEIGENRQRITAETVLFAHLGSPAGDPDYLPFQARSAMRALIYASPVIDEPVAVRGPFVMNTEEELDQAFADYRAGRLTEPTTANAVRVNATLV
jgi:redox-sensitive bicupin YhaK (pirin superfamily)